MKKIRRKKRTTFAKLFARNAAIALLVTAVFAGAIFFVGTEYILSEAENSLYLRESAVQESVTDDEVNFRTRLRTMAELHTIPLGNPLGNTDLCQISPNHTDNCSSLIVILDEKGEILYSSRKKLLAVIRFSEDEKQKMYCNEEGLNVPGLVQLEEDYYAMLADETMHTTTKIRMTSAYVNREKNSFIPHEVTLELKKYNDYGFVADKIIRSEQYTIDMPAVDGYELVQLTEWREEETTYPCVLTCAFLGTNSRDFDEILYGDEMQNILQSDLENDRRSSGFYDGTVTAGTYYKEANIMLNGEKRMVLIVFKIDAWNNATKPLFFTITALFLFVALLIALLDSWRRNVKYQAEYAFEDYQKALTNNLAHDLKTPLMAIGGYAENVLESGLSEEEKNRYLTAILDNVSYTDSIITRTLALNNMDENSELRREPVNVQKLVEAGEERYELLLDERNITVNVTGQAEVTADADMLETAIENLISNAVKYTSENGTIQIEISQKACRITNTVREKVDVADLKKPFVKGDKARSGKLGSGLGLSIADKAASANGFRLELSCSDTEFTAVLKF